MRVAVRGRRRTDAPISDVERVLVARTGDQERDQDNAFGETSHWCCPIPCPKRQNLPLLAPEATRFEWGRCAYHNLPPQQSAAAVVPALVSRGPYRRSFRRARAQLDGRNPGTRRYRVAPEARHHTIRRIRPATASQGSSAGRNS